MEGKPIIVKCMTKYSMDIGSRWITAEAGMEIPTDFTEEQLTQAEETFKRGWEISKRQMKEQIIAITKKMSGKQ